MKTKVKILILILTLSACASNKYIKFNETHSGNIFLSCLEKEKKKFMSIILDAEQMIVRTKTYRFITSNDSVRSVIADNYLTEYGKKEHYLWLHKDQLFKIEKDSFNTQKTYADTEDNYRCKRHSNYSAFRDKEERVVYAVFIKGTNKESANNLKQIKYRSIP
jgi:hypothetical protein